MALDICTGIILFLLVACLCVPLWSLGVALLWLGQKSLDLGHWLHFWLQKQALKAVKRSES